MARVYLGAVIRRCCLNRPFDDQSQDRIRLEAEAVLLILSGVASGAAVLISSEAVLLEAARIPDPERRHRVLVLMESATVSRSVGRSEIERARELTRAGFRPVDALHLACAEAEDSDVFLTTDDRLLRRARRRPSTLRVRVANPLAWIQEGMEYG